MDISAEYSLEGRVAGLDTTKPASMTDADFQSYREELQQTPGSALAHFRLGESFFEDRNFQAAAHEFRAALNGDPHPNWIDAWAHIDLGEIFDATRQRDRAIRESDDATSVCSSLRLLFSPRWGFRVLSGCSAN